MVVPFAGCLTETGDRYEPYRLAGADGAAVEAVTAYFRDLLAAGRADSTVRSYGMDLLRWFGFLWAAGVAWDRATRAEARDFPGGCGSLASNRVRTGGARARPPGPVKPPRG